MSRSRRKVAVFSNGSSNSRKQDRQFANRKFRRKEKELLHHLEELDEETLPEKVAEVSDIWDWDCDGWKYWNEAPEEALRK
jgi:hypothetical protein